MAVYKLFPEKDSSIYSGFSLMNTGIDEILEVSTFYNSTSPEVSRYLIKFSQNILFWYLFTYLSLFIQICRYPYHFFFSFSFKDLFNHWRYVYLNFNLVFLTIWFVKFSFYVCCNPCSFANFYLSILILLYLFYCI